MANESEKGSIVDYWRAIELFSPQSVPRVAPNDGLEPVYPGKEGVPLPWDSSHPLRSRRLPARTSRRYLVYCGIFKLEKVRLILEEKFGKDPEVFDERSDGETCVFAFSVSDDGRPLFDTFVLSTCAWATARTLNPGPDRADWLIGFEKAMTKASDEFAARYAVQKDDNHGQEIQEKGFKLGRLLKYTDILIETKRIARELGIVNIFEGFEIRIKAGLVASKKKFSSEEQDFLNSFFVRDLSRISVQVRHNNLGNGLSIFLSGVNEINTSDRVDIRESVNTQFQRLSPSLFSPGRWLARIITL